MDEVFYEQLVEDSRKERGTFFRVLLVVVPVVLLVGLWFIEFVRLYLWTLLAILCFTAVLFLWRRCYNEYEYIFTDGQLDVDRIFSKQTRKHLVSINAKEIMLVAPIQSEKNKRYFEMSYDINIDAGDHRKDEKAAHGKYYLLARKGDKTLKLLFQPNEQILKLLKQYAPHKVIIEGAPEREIRI